MKNSILMLCMFCLISCNNDDNSDENVVETTEIETIINDITSNSNLLDGSDVVIEGFLNFQYSANVIFIECDHPCGDSPCNYEASNDYLVRDTYRCPSIDRYEISSVEGNYENAINLGFSFTDGINFLNLESGCEGVVLENYPITISGKLKYGTANNHALMLEQKNATIIIDENTIDLLNGILICTDE